MTEHTEYKRSLSEINKKVLLVSDISDRNEHGQRDEVGVQNL